MTKEAVMQFIGAMVLTGNKQRLEKVIGKRGSGKTVDELILKYPELKELDLDDSREIKGAFSHNKSLTDIAVVLGRYLSDRYGNE